MTDQHPLDYDTCEAIAPSYLESEDCCNKMRAAADWQLEQVIKWLEATEYDQYHYGTIIYANDLRKAMRPQENN